MYYNRIESFQLLQKKKLNCLNFRYCEFECNENAIAIRLQTDTYTYNISMALTEMH